VTRLLIATTNRGKQGEFRRLLADLEAVLVTPDQVGLELDVDEPYDTYAENASAKADAFARASGLVSLADDSGIEIAALDWGPGVRSARWGGGRNAERVLEALADGTLGAEPDRRARMVCALAVAVPADADPRVEVFTGVVEGRVAAEMRGAGGFGYDPIFELPSGHTTAELPEGEKDRLSHRGRAVQAALPRLREVLAAD
jgi:XTP/dITP diphosphohydrolase